MQLIMKDAYANMHVIYAYLQIGRIIREEREIPDWLREHPHANHDYTSQIIP